MRIRLGRVRRYVYSTRRRYVGGPAVTDVQAALSGDGTLYAAFTATAPELVVELGINADPGTEYLTLDDDTRGLLDTGILAGDTTLWEDISDYVLSVETSRGRQRLLEQYRTGTAKVVVDNLDARFSPHNLSGPYVSSGVTLLQPERRLRIRAYWEGDFYPLFEGFVDAFSTSWGHPEGAFVTITASDAFKVLARYDPIASSSPVGEGEATGARITRLLDYINWPDGDRDLDTGDSTLQSTTIAQNILTELFLTVDSEFGAVYVSADGKITFDERSAIYTQERSNSVQATFGDGADEVPYFDLDISPFDAELVKNTISIARIGGMAQTSSDSTSQARYFQRPYKRTDLLMQTDAEAGHWADLLLELTKDAEQRIEAVSIRGLPDDTGRNVWEQMLSRQLRDRVRVIRRPDEGDEFDQELFIEGVEHRIRGTNDWVTKFQTAPAKTASAPPY